MGLLARFPAALLAVAALFGALAPIVAGWLRPAVFFNFGPSDHSYLSGFTPEWEIDPDGLATPWSRHHAQVRLPLHLAAGPGRLRLRGARVFPQTGTTEVRVNGALVDRFESRGGTFVERSVELPTLPPGPLAISLDTIGDDGRDRGLRMDWLDVEGRRIVPERKVVLTAAAISLVFAALAIVTLGHGPATIAAAVGLPLAMLAYGLLAGVFPLAHLLLRAGFIVLLAVVAMLAPVRRVSSREARIAVWLTVVALCLRLGGLFHPLYYYPDLRAHAGLARIVGEVGLDFWRRPAFYIEQQGVWAEAALGKTYAFPFSPVFHAFFAPWAGDLLQTMDAMKLVACVLSSLEVAIVFAIGTRIGGGHVGLWSAALAAVSPPSFSRLGWAFLAAIFAHLFDSLALKSLFDGPLEKRRVVAFAAFLLAGLVSYPGSLINFAVFVPVAAAGLSLSREPGSRREALTLLAIAAGAAIVAIAVAYNEFLRTFMGNMLPRFVSGESRAGTFGLAATAAMAGRRLFAFFNWWYVPIFLAAPVVWWRMRPSPRHGRLLIAWAATFLVLVFLRTAAPDLFSRVKEMLWVSPLVAIAGGTCLDKLAERGTSGRVIAWAAAGWLAAYGIAFYAHNIAEKFVLAR